MDSSNKADTPFLLKAVEAVKSTNWVGSYDLNRVHIAIRKDRYQGRDFFAEKGGSYAFTRT